jgi:hypothetical protein
MSTTKQHAIDRLNATGLTMYQLREVAAGLNRPNFLSRIRDAGLTIEEVKDLVRLSNDQPSGVPPSDRASGE